MKPVNIPVAAADTAAQYWTLRAGIASFRPNFRYPSRLSRP